MANAPALVEQPGACQQPIWIGDRSMGRKFIPRVPCVCLKCGRAFEQTRVNVENGRGQHCSKACAYANMGRHRRHEPNCVCAGCGAMFHRLPGKLKSGRRSFCSRGCSDRFTESLEKRIWPLVDYGGPACWEWTGCRDKAGYGVLNVEIDGKRRPVHVTRLIWRLIHGAFPILACHRCDNPACCRPSHLFNDTDAGNARDKVVKGRARGGGLRGEQANGAKLTWVQVREIRVRRAAGEQLQPLADAYGVNWKTMQLLCAGKTWKDTI